MLRTMLSQTTYCRDNKPALLYFLNYRHSDRRLAGAVVVQPPHARLHNGSGARGQRRRSRQQRHECDRERVTAQ